MTRQQKIQAAIDALPDATGGEWRPSRWTPTEVWVQLPVSPGLDYPHAIALQYTSGRDGPLLPKGQQEANATLIAASKDLAEEVVRLRGLVKRADAIFYLMHIGDKSDLSGLIQYTDEQRNALAEEANAAIRERRPFNTNVLSDKGLA